MIDFLLNDERITLEEVNPNTTVLEYLREHRQRKGTKEGCASGDCGACTVTLVQLNDDAHLEYKSINACITLVSALAGKQLICIEDLKPNQALHSTQQAMVDTDGSQCGFCTPGFVMSLFTLQKNQKQYDRHKVQQALAGNLCRCTGYKAIDNAAKQILVGNVVDHFDPKRDQTIEKLQQITLPTTSSVALKKGHFAAYIPTDTQTLAQLLIDLPDSQIVAGGTDIAIAVTQHGELFKQIISIQQVKELQQHRISQSSIEIGAAVTLAQCQIILKPHFEDFALLLERFASLQIRNQGTLGGNIANASPIGDTPPALIALGASLLLRCADKQRTVLLEDFFIDYRKTQLQTSEFIEKIIIPTFSLPTGQRSVFKVYKISKRLDDDISAICAACSIILDNNNTVIDIKLAYGGMAAIAKRALQTEKQLINKTFSLANVETAVKSLSNDFQPLSDFRASRDYRILVAQNLLRKFHLECSTSQEEEQTKTRIFDYV